MRQQASRCSRHHSPPTTYATDAKLQALLLQYFDHLGRTASPNTLRAYRSDIFSSITPDTTWTELNAPTRTYWHRIFLNKTELLSNARLVAAWKGFFRFCTLRGESVSSGLLKIRPQKIKHKIFSVPDSDDLMQYLQRPPSGWIDCRNRALCTLLYATGMRISEALSVRSWQSTSMLRVVGKGDRVRDVPVLKIAQTCIQEYIDQCPLPTDGWLFVGARGQQLSYFVAYKAMRATPWGNGAHGLRRSAATHLLRKNLDIESVRMLLGHAKLSTTQRYVIQDPQHLQARYLTSQAKQVQASKPRQHSIDD